MRRRIWITAACLFSLALPALPALAARVPVAGPASPHSGATPRNMAVERSLLRRLMIQRHQLVGVVAAQNGARGQALALAMLDTADAVLSGDAAALARAIAPPRRRIRRATAKDRAHSDLFGSPLELMPAAPGALWSPASRGLAPGPLAWMLSASVSAHSAARQAIAPLLAMSLAALTSWAALLPSTDGVQPQVPSTTALPGVASSPAASTMSSAPLEPTSAVTRSVELGDPSFAAPAHGALSVDAGSGVAPIAAANATVAAALLAPAVTPTAVPTATVPATATASPASQSVVPPAQPPTIQSLRRRYEAVLADLAQVRVFEAWARANGPASALTAYDVITSPETLSARLDSWNASVPLSTTLDVTVAMDALATPSPAATGSTAPALTYQRLRGLEGAAAGSMLSPTPAATGTSDTRGQRVAVPAVALGATLALSGSADGDPAAGVAISATVAPETSGGAAISAIADLTDTQQAPSNITVPLTLSAVTAVTVPLTGTPEAGSTALTATAALTGSTAGMPFYGSWTATPAASGLAVAASPSPSVPLTATVATSVTAPLSASAGLTETVPTSVTAPATAALDLAIAGGAPVLTVTAGLSATAPFTLLVTMPVSAAQALAPAGFLRERGALESVLRQGEALYAQLQAGQAGAEASYRAQLNAVVTLNSYIERRWLARYNAYLNYLRAYPAYRRRVAAFNAYAHAMHMSQLAREQWRQRMAAWTRYAQQMAAYKAALAARSQLPTVPISGTAPASGTVSLAGAPLPPKPVMPPFPGPEPPPFTEQPPPWPGAPPVYVGYPGPEPVGYALPLPPDAIPAWDGLFLPLTISSFGGIDAGIVGAVGREETTQAALVADGALDGVQAYQDPIKGVITTYWGGHTIFQSFHPGIDIAAPMYTPVHAAAAGLVVWADYAVPGQRHESYGLCVIIKHNDHFSTLYAHMDDERYGLQVRAGDTVQQGQVIGYVGMTGWTTGPHLHFEMRENNVQFNPLLLIPDPQS